MESNITRKELRDFGFLMAFCFPIIIGFIIPFIFGEDFKFWTFFVAIPSLFLGIFKPLILHYPYKFWMVLGKILGWINSRIILGLIFFFVLIPISFFMKMIGYDPLKKINKLQVTYTEEKYNNKIDLTRIL